MLGGLLLVRQAGSTRCGACFARTSARFLACLKVHGAPLPAVAQLVGHRDLFGYFVRRAGCPVGDISSGSHTLALSVAPDFNGFGCRSEPARLHRAYEFATALSGFIAVSSA